MKIAAIILFCLTITQQLSSQTKPTPSGVKEVIVVFKTHFDIGYTDWADNVSYNYSHGMVTGALDVIEKSKQLPESQQFKWTVAGWPMKEMLAKSKPEVKQRIEKAIKEGNFQVHGLPFTFETEACDLEPLVRSLEYSSKISRDAGLSLPIDAKQTDVPGHSWILPTILTNAGIKFLHIGCNAASKSPEVPLLFWWEGPDKSLLMTMYFGPYYGTTPAPPQGWPYQTWMAIIHTNDNTGAPTYEQFKEAIKDIERQNPGAKVRTGSMADFYNSIMKEHPELPVVKGDMPDTWIHGYMSMPREVKSGRDLSKTATNLEALNALAAIWGANNEKGIVPIVDSALEQIQLFDEHSFGMAMSHGHAGYWAYGDEFEDLRAKGLYEPIEYSWKEKSNHITFAAKYLYPALSREIKGLAAAVNVPGERIVVYNPLPWERSELVTIQTIQPLKKALKNLTNGEIVPVSRNRNIVQFHANHIPSMGYATFVPVDELSSNQKTSLVFNAGNSSIENKFFRIVFDPQNGTIKSLIDKKSGREAVNPNEEFQFGQYVYERFSKQNTDKYAKDYIKGGWDWAYAELGRINLTDEPYKRTSGKNAHIEYLKDSVSVSAVMHFNATADLKHNYSLTFSLTENRPSIEMIWSINGKPADSWPEGGWISFPFNIDKPIFKLGRPGAVVDPSLDFINGSNRDYCFLNTGMAVLDSNNQGFGIMSPDVPGISLDRPGLWSYSPTFVPKKANVFFNLYNNQWSTNFTEWVEGSWSTRFYIWSIDKYSNASSVVIPSEEIRNPLICALATGKTGNLPAVGHGISLSEKGILITFFGKNRDGAGDILRLWEQNGTSTSCKVTLPAESKYKFVQPCNLRGEKKGKAFPVINHSFDTPINAYQPVSFILLK
ncbi:MAG: glycoside hydrolase family 38 C-terminal domain-containing protein [Mariniphaga sp.]